MLTSRICFGKVSVFCFSYFYLGDPICDQYCFERYQNRTLFAVCNWGVKVRQAAKLTYLCHLLFLEMPLTSGLYHYDIFYFSVWAILMCSCLESRSLRTYQTRFWRCCSLQLALSIFGIMFTFGPSTRRLYLFEEHIFLDWMVLSCIILWVCHP